VLLCLAISCPEGMIYQQCGQVCPQRCDIDETVDCIGGCVEGCFCPSGYILSNGNCTSCQQGMCVTSLVLHYGPVYFLSLNFVVLCNASGKVYRKSLQGFRVRVRVREITCVDDHDWKGSNKTTIHCIYLLKSIL